MINNRSESNSGDSEVLIICSSHLIEPSYLSLAKIRLRASPEPPPAPWYRSPSSGTDSPWSCLTSLSLLNQILTLMINGHFQLKNFSWKALWSSNHSLVTPPGNDRRRNLHIPVIFSLIKRTTPTSVLVFYLFVCSMLDISSEPSTHYRAGHGTADSHQ